jgi:hypothetical protein
MMRTFLITIISAFFLGCGVENEISIILNNPVDMERMDEIVEIQRAKLILQDSEHMVILDGDKEIPFDLMDTTLVINVDFEPNESKVLKIISGKTSSSTFPKRAHAEISVRTEGRFENGRYVDGSAFKNLEKIRIPAWHVAHDDYIRYEGPVW